MNEDPTARIFAALERLEGGQARIEAGQVLLSARIDKLEASQLTVRADLMARMDRLQDGFERIRDDLTVNYGRADHAQRATVNVRDELDAVYGLIRGGQKELATFSEVTGAMERQIRRLQADFEALQQQVASRMGPPGA